MEHEMLIGTVRRGLMYRSQEAFSALWERVFPDEILPDDDIAVPAKKISTLLVSLLSMPQRGRSAAITKAATEMLNRMERPIASGQPAPPPALPEPEAAKPEPELSAEIKRPTVAAPTFLKSTGKLIREATALDLVFLFVLIVADYSLFYLLKEIGFAWAVVYTLISLHALGMTKNRYTQATAVAGIWAVVVLEFLSFFIHLTMLNLRVWQAAKAGDLPFSPDENPAGPFYIALAMALVFSAAAVYAVAVTLSVTVEKVAAANYEKNSKEVY